MLSPSEIGSTRAIPHTATYFYNHHEAVEQWESEWERWEWYKIFIMDFLALNFSCCELDGGGGEKTMELALATLRPANARTVNAHFKLRLIVIFTFLISLFFLVARLHSSLLGRNKPLMGRNQMEKRRRWRSGWEEKNVRKLAAMAGEDFFLSALLTAFYYRCTLKLEITTE